ncbi:uncharacterized protein LOC125498892 [Beta vulgaris subsp. vulgaris]|uniref:uncharacterized protein LOC125498892 n=1 Tax=Beta vulgaris subsp. vulgaris TaxID=3555 RepID=UPI0020371757|nr:uncharacterized protein LOC125498892 [Beta vulgaris subsp. vulgaris]
MGDLVDKYQNAFVPGRQMSDNCFISHEIINWVKKRKKGNSFAGILKVDLSKAYDRIRWDFVEAMLRKMNFPEIWVQWIMQCITTVSYAVLVNGEPSQTIFPSAGLRQGDPLSSYIFILCMEVLSRNLTHLQNMKELEGLKIARTAPKISHLFFADDALFFFKAQPKNCWTIKNVLSTFCEKSGEMINFEKSHVIFSPNTPIKFTKIMRKPLGVQVKGKIGNYLGCPMEIDGRSSASFNEITTKTVNKILSWKFSRLSPAAKLILINTILTSLASHIVSIYLLPRKITKKLSSTLLKFWWSSSMEKKPIYWRKKEVLENHKQQGGLGFRNIEKVNKALLFNQAWRIHQKKGSLINQVFTAKYRKDPLQMAIDDEAPSNCSYAYRSLFRACQSFKEGLHKRLGNEKTIRIDKDTWHHQGKSLKPKMREDHPSRENYKMVSDIIDQDRRWKQSVIWNIFPKEEAREILATLIPQGEEEDELEWSHTKSGRFTVKSGYWFLQNNTNNQDKKEHFWKDLWKSNIFPKWKHFIWKIMHNAVPTAENLCKRSILQVDTNCRLCKTKRETTQHLFRDCEISKRIWKASMGIVTDQSAQISIQDWIRNFLNLLRKKKKNADADQNAEAQFISTLWGIWVHRNEIIFQETRTNPSRILEIIKDHNRRLLESNNKKTEQEKDSNSSLITDGRQAIVWTVGKKTGNVMQTLVVDGAWANKKGNQWQAAIAWKNKNGLLGEESASRIFANSPVQTEAYAILKALQDMKWKCSDITIHTDNIEVVQALTSQGRTNKNIAQIIVEIKRAASSYHFVSCIKVRREAVNLAHDLAAKARKGLVNCSPF